MHNDSLPPVPAELRESQAARAWLCQIAAGFAAGSLLVRYLCDDRPQGRQRFEGEPAADQLLRAWEAEGVIVRGALQRLTPEQQINSRGSARLANHYGWTPGPAFRAPAWTPAPGGRPRLAWEDAIEEERALPRGTRDADGYLLVTCPAGGPNARPVPYHWRRGREGYCSACSSWHDLRPDGRLPKHLCADLLAPRAEVAP